MLGRPRESVRPIHILEVTDMLTWLESYAKTHLFYIILIAVGVVGFKTWLVEHDARVLAEVAVKQSDAKVKDLQAQIASTTANATMKIGAVTRVIQGAKTPAQQLAAIPQLTDAPINARTMPSLPDGVVAVDLAPLVAELGQCKQDTISLGACTENFNTCQQIVKEREAEVAVLKKKPAFWHRLLGVAKAVGVGVGIGVVLGVKL